MEIKNQPDDIIQNHILVYLNLVDLIRCARVSRLFCSLSHSVRTTRIKNDIQQYKTASTPLVRLFKHIEPAGAFFMSFTDIHTPIRHSPIAFHYSTPHQIVIKHRQTNQIMDHIQIEPGNLNHFKNGHIGLTTREFTSPHLHLHIPSRSFVLILCGKLVSITLSDKKTVIYSAIQEQVLASWHVIANCLNEIITETIRVTPATTHPPLSNGPAHGPAPVTGGFWIGSNTASIILANNNISTSGVHLIRLHNTMRTTIQRCFTHLYLLYTTASRQIDAVCSALDICGQLNAHPEQSPLQWKFPF